MEALNTQLLRLFDWLLWTTIQGSVLIVLIVLIQLILRRRLPVRWHYLLWGLLLIRLAVPWLPESKISIFNLVPRSIQQGRIIESLSQRDDVGRFGFYSGMRSAGTQETKPESGSRTIFAKFVRMLPLLWLLGTVVIAGYVCARSVSLWRTVKRERPITDSEILDLLEDCKMQMGVQTILGVVVSDRIKSPALFGFVRPRLLLPQGMLETYGLEELRYVFIHELAHLKQRDIYLGWLMALLQVIHWFNPLMWFAFGRMRADRELACDTLAISTMAPHEPPEYGRTIVSLLQSFSQARYLPSVAGILEDTCQIERRVKMIADYKKTSRTRWAGAMFLLAALACIVLTNAYVAKADFIFADPVNVGPPVSTSASDYMPMISTDDLSLYFCRASGASDPGALWLTTRATKHDSWGTATNLGSLANWLPVKLIEGVPGLVTADSLELYGWGPDGFYAPTGYGGVDIYVMTRLTPDDEWGAPENLGPVVNSSADEAMVSVSPDGLELYFSGYGDQGKSVRPGGNGQSDLWVTKRATRNDPWGKPVNLGPTVNSPSQEHGPSISADGLVLFFGSERSGGYGHADLYVTRRASRSSLWGQALNLGPAINSLGYEALPRISTDGRTLYFNSGRPGGYGDDDIWQVSVLPVVDFNGDGIVDCVDICMLVDHLDTNEPLYDIAPVPFGDGVVDAQDLIVLTEHLTKKQGDPNAVTP